MPAGGGIWLLGSRVDLSTAILNYPYDNFFGPPGDLIPELKPGQS